MLTFIIRRLLYSIPVLIATSFLIFTFVSITGDPLGRLRANPNITADTEAPSQNPWRSRSERKRRPRNMNSSVTGATITVAMTARTLPAVERLWASICSGVVVGRFDNASISADKIGATTRPSTR